MHDKAISAAAERVNQTDQAIMGLLLIGSPGPWAVEEMAREIGHANTPATGWLDLSAAD